MVLTDEAQRALQLLARRKQKNPTLHYWRRYNPVINEWICLACNMILSSEDDADVHAHGLECLKKHKLLVFL